MTAQLFIGIVARSNFEAVFSTHFIKVHGADSFPRS